MRRHKVSDETWEVIAPVLPGKKGDPGRTAKNNRKTETILIVLFSVAVAVAIAAQQLQVPYTVALVLTGLTLEFAKRADELYDERRRGVHDRKEAEREVSKGSHEGKGVR